MKFKAVIISMAVIYCNTALYAINDLWLGHWYSVKLGFAIYHIPYVDPPKPKTISYPNYPSDLFYSGVTGTATIKFSVDENGAVRDVRVISTTEGEFGSEACRAVKTWSFDPAKHRQTGNNISMRMQCRFDFAMGESDRPAVIEKENDHDTAAGQTR